MLRFDGSATLADNVEIVVGDGADLTVRQHRRTGTTTPSTSATSTPRSAATPRFKHVDVTFGGDVVRHDTTAEYAGPGGEVEMLGLYFADAGQHIEHRLFVDHNAPKTKSHVTYKGALQGQGAHTVWIGNVLIRKVAEGIETYEENRNLVLTDGCQADSVPNLEIETGEIEGAGHASATGRFDDEQLFYLRSRGIAEDEARRLVVHGFFNDLIRRIGVPELEEQLAATVEAELAKNVLHHDARRCLHDASSAPARSTSSATARRSRVDDRRPGRRGRPRRRRGLRDRGHCSHAAVALSEGDVEDCTVECWLHGSRFDLRTGKPTGLPATEPVRDLPRRGTRRPTCYVDVTTTLNGVTTHMSTLEIKDLHVSVKTDDEDKEILKGVTLTIKDGETHAIMGPNGSGKSTLAYSIAGHPKYTVTSGSVTLDGAGRARDDASTQRARAGLFLAMQYPVEVPGVSVSNFLRTAKTALDGEAPKLRTWVKDVNAALEQLEPRPDVRHPLGQRGLLRR